MQQCFTECKINMFIYFILYSLLLYCSFFFHLSHCVACRILVPGPGLRPELLWWERRVQTTGLTEPQTPGNINQSEVSQRSSFWHQYLALPNHLQTPVLDTSGQTTSKTGTQPHPSKKMRRQKNMLLMKEQGKNL